MSDGQPPRIQPKTEKHLGRLVSQFAETNGLSVRRIRQRVSAMAFLGALERVREDDSPARFLLKGGGKRKQAGMPRAHAGSPIPRVGRLYPLRGRVRCGMCGRRIEGSHRKGSNWYRCQYVRRCSEAAAIYADHPQVPGIKEAKVLEAILALLARRVFGPDRLRLLRDELADATSSTWEEHKAELERLEGELSTSTVRCAHRRSD